MIDVPGNETGMPDPNKPVGAVGEEPGRVGGSSASTPTSPRLSAVPMPPAIARLPRDHHGRPVPWFVHYVDGVPDFRVIRARGIELAYQHRWCWVCGRPIAARYKAFVIGPMCAVNRTSAEPPSHKECAVYSALACPFLSTPNMVRRDKHLGAHTDPAGIMISRNPGVALVWVTTRFERFSAPGGYLFDIGEASQALWFAQGRNATREEVTESMRTGLPQLMEVAEREGPDAVRELEVAVVRAQVYLPAA